MNNHVFFHALHEPDCPLVAEREYLGTVDAVQLSEHHVAVRSEGRIHVHALGEGAAAAQEHLLPDKSDERDITCMAMSKDFLVYGTARGTIVYVSIADFAQISEYRHEAGIVKIFPN